MQYLQFNKITISLLLLTGTIFFGTTGFWLIDDYPFIDALYMSVITITTVGFGEIYPLSELGRLFTVILILFGFVVLGFVGHSIVESLLERVWTGNTQVKRMKKRVSRLKQHHILCGFGRVGEIAAQHLAEAGADFVVIEAAEDRLEVLKQKKYLYVAGDATRESSLLEAGIKEASGLLALVESDPLNLFIVLTAREVNPTLHIIARSEDKGTEKKIIRAGADSIISPFDSAGRHIADNLLAATGGYRPSEKTETVDLQLQWINIQQGSVIIGTTIGDVAATIGREVLGLRRQAQDTLQPQEKTLILQGDQLLVLADMDESAIEGGLDAIPPKIVIVDDNPVITRLFSRLFQKAGFHPFIAENGEAGFELILKEQPVAAVIDYQLPGLSGLEVCQKIRASKYHENIKLIVFTADDAEDVRQRCLEAGADKVIVKSSEASEIIRVVSSLLKSG